MSHRPPSPHHARALAVVAAVGIAATTAIPSGAASPDTLTAGPWVVRAGTQVSGTVPITGASRPDPRIAPGRSTS